MKLNKIFLLLLGGLLGLTSCQVSVPAAYVESSDTLVIYPDYRDIIIPVNIAPMNFRINAEADGYVTRISGQESEALVAEGQKTKFDLKQWKQLLEANQNNDLQIETFLKKDGQWIRYQVGKLTVSPDPIDEYISYRLIAPSYVTYGELSICQRNITNFETRDIYNNSAVTMKHEEQCINCHSYQNYRTDNMQFHARNLYGGTLIVSDGEPKKVNIKAENLISGGVYPAWHPTEKLIAYSVNSTGQYFHSKDLQKVEVLDSESDLVLFDVETNEVSVILNDSNSFETFPAWSPDGKTLYYASAYLKPSGLIPMDEEVGLRYKEIKYDIIRMDFDIDTRTFGVADTVFKASSINKSATLPRISPDGNYLLFTLGDFGTFHIWHKSSDLMLMDLRTGLVDPLTEVNSHDVESYHTWSSSGRWFIFSSRRDDGSYTRPYIAYFDRDGKAHKPFIVPQEDPDFYKQLYKSFNIPEFMVEPVKLSLKDFAQVLRGETIQATLKGDYSSSGLESDKENLY